jgi:hypothetical protein
LQGLNATLFVYGQTGSGKTFTMNHVVRSAAADIFEAIDQAPDREFLLRLTAVEIYNEKVRDLLAEHGDRQNLSLVEDPERGVVAEGCTDVGLESSDQLSNLLKKFEARRTVSLSPALQIFPQLLSRHPLNCSPDNPSTPVQISLQLFSKHPCNCSPNIPSIALQTASQLLSKHLLNCSPNSPSTALQTAPQLFSK